MSPVEKGVRVQNAAEYLTSEFNLMSECLNYALTA